MKTKKPRKIGLIVKECRKIASDLAKGRDKYACLRCCRSDKQGWKIDASHIKPKGTHNAMSADVDNIKALCANCHRWWHSNPTESGLWFEKTYPEWHQRLKTRSQRTIKMGRYEWTTKLAELKKLREINETN